jgi:hypothetical protein
MDEYSALRTGVQSPPHDRVGSVKDPAQLPNIITKDENLALDPTYKPPSTQYGFVLEERP